MVLDWENYELHAKVGEGRKVDLAQAGAMRARHSPGEDMKEGALPWYSLSKPLTVILMSFGCRQGRDATRAKRSKLGPCRPRKLERVIGQKGVWGRD